MTSPDRSTALKVLYVEDDELILELGRVALADIGGLSVKGCQSGGEAIEALDTCKPDVLLLDVVMPGMDGPTLLKEIRRRQLSEAPVIFMTSQVDYTHVKQYMDLDAIAVVKKPFDPLTLADELVLILARKSAARTSVFNMASSATHAEGRPLYTRLPED